MTYTRSQPAVRTRSPRVMLGLVEVAGYYGNLLQGFTELGVSASLVTVVDHPFAYESGPSARLSRWVRHAGRKRTSGGVGRLGQIVWLIVEAALRASLFVWAIRRFDVFVLGFGVTFLGLPHFELPILRLLGKRIIAVFHGSDSRPPYLDGSIMLGDSGSSAAACVELTRAAKRRVATFDRFAHAVVDHPLSAHFHERRCIQWLQVGLPYGTDAGAVIETAADSSSPGIVRILHAPSHPELKGTPRIRQIIDRLRARGHRIEYIEIYGQPHAHVVRELRRCDLVIDQLYSDTPMAGFAAEAANLGKPAVVGGYGGASLCQWMRRDEWPPSAYCHPDTVEAALEQLLIDSHCRSALAQRAREFVRTQWSPRAVAQRYMQIIQEQVPTSWTFNPAEIRYAHGVGLAEDRARQAVASIVDAGGRGALQLADKPQVQNVVLAFGAANAD